MSIAELDAISARVAGARGLGDPGGPATSPKVQDLDADLAGSTPARRARPGATNLAHDDTEAPTIRHVTEAIAVLSFEAYLDAEQALEHRHELVGSRVYAMAGGSERHDLAAGLIYEALAGGARSRGCRPFTSNRLVRTRSGNAYYPDVMVACGRAAHRLYETDPALIVEVLSSSTADVDRREKAVAYAEASSLGLLLLVDPDARRIEVARPAEGTIRNWMVYGAGTVLATDFGDIDIDALYDAIDRTATTA